MSYITYRDNIIREFGGNRKKKLTTMMDNYLKLYKGFIVDGETEHKPAVKAKPKIDYKDDFHYFLKDTYEESLEAIESSLLKPYDKGRAVAYMCKFFPKWHAVKDLTPETYVEFLKQWEMNSLLEIDEERNCEYFRHI